MARRRSHRGYGASRRSSVGPIGTIDIHARGYAFCDTDEGSFFVPRSALGGAMPGDKVELRVSSRDVPDGGKRSAKVTRVVSRATEYLIGTLEINDPLAVVVAQDPRVRHDLFITDGHTGGAHDGDVVLARITSYPDRRQPMQGYDLDSYRKILLPTDFKLDQMTGNLLNTNFNGITPEIKEILNKCPESEKTGYVYYSEERHKMEPALLKTWETLAEKNKENWTDYEKQIWEETKADNTVKVHFLGISEAVFDMLEWKGEKCSWDTFKSGDYVIVDYSDKYTEEPVSYYQSGETFKMEYGNGKQKDYGVIGEAMMPYSLDYPYADSVYITVMVPEEEYITQTGNQSAMYAAIDAKKGEDKQVKEYIDKNVLKENDMINVSSVLDMKASFRRFVSKYYMIGSFLVIILAFIGIMNFFNTTATSVISRKKELALLEVVGMTKKQVSKMLVTEGFLYLGGAFVIAVLLIMFGAKQILVNTLGTAFFFRLHLTIVPCVLMIPILVGIAYVIPKYQFEKMSRESIVERIRKE